MTQTREKREIKATKVFYRVLAALDSGKRYIVNEGGSRSSKTYSTMQVLIYKARYTPGLSITVVSRSLPALKKGALRDFLNIINAWGWYVEDWHNKSDEIYTFPNGSYIEFFGLEKSDRARGPGRKILFANECNLFGKELFDQLDMRTEETVIMDLNPADFSCYAYDIADGPDAVKIHSTYKDNPSLPAAQVKVIEGYRKVDPNGLMWRVFGLGLRGASERQIYTHYRSVPEMPGKGAVWYGLDFGFNVPTALIKIEHYDGEIYLQELIYETQLTTSQLIERMGTLGIGPYAYIYCDAAEPKTIQEIINAGYNATPADKDVTEGIRKVKSLPLFILETSTNLLREFGGYLWKTNKDGKVLDEPDKEAGNDHAADAVRYGVFTQLRNPELDFFIK